jgi:hypothetical protein
VGVCGAGLVRVFFLAKFRQNFQLKFKLLKKVTLKVFQSPEVRGKIFKIFKILMFGFPCIAE